MRKAYMALFAGSLAFTATAHAVPNMWTSGFGMGVTEYIITSPEKVMFNLSCTGNPDAQNILQHSVLLTLSDGTQVDSHDDKTAITVVMENRQFPLPSSLGWRNADNAWAQFITALGQAKDFDAYVNDKKVGSFHAESGNVRAVLSDIASCPNTAG